jgi:hypothetical protein
VQNTEYRIQKAVSGRLSSNSNDYDEGNIMGDNEQANTNSAVDDQGTSESEGRELLKRLRDSGFESSDEKLALALGRPVEEVAGWMGGAAPVDDDVVMKARGIAGERGIDIE